MSAVRIPALSKLYIYIEKTKIKKKRPGRDIFKKLPLANKQGGKNHKTVKMNKIDKIFIIWSHCWQQHSAKIFPFFHFTTTH